MLRNAELATGRAENALKAHAPALGPGTCGDIAPPDQMALHPRVSVDANRRCVGRDVGEDVHVC